ncbi:DMSO reductase anchor subunit [Stella humosa]|uniref:DMSO reductase anchor subunit n=1 Tax=Stella humosa TaxID=94 RepID=A0A3N1MCV3_9PROT|nr:DmsC/YnfH family molybdoenzyme membrane anchor subunit [Stella humosa]ROQ01533.1 DMSO reductase anchor subunit [Stella humosa]BBK31912.1 DMSO reductase [Stella humosa]
MHPALSVIAFTTASGAGYGLLALLGILAPMGLLPASAGFAFVATGLALAAIAGGLLSSTLHLGHPERAWRAMSQWRTSWLSREGLVAVVTFVPAGLFAAAWVFGGAISALLGLLAALGAVATVYCTAMIYASLKPIQRWNNGWVAPNYLAMGAMTGALWLHLLCRLFAFPASAVAWIAVLATVAAMALKLGYWRFIDGSQSASTPESATGLGRIGKVRLLEAPHTSENYLLEEMGFRIARKHARKLRLIALLAGFVAPLLLALLALLVPGPAGALAALLAAPLATAGVLVERWLFFAEARHTVMLYYGATAA